VTTSPTNAGTLTFQAVFVDKSGGVTGVQESSFSVVGGSCAGASIKAGSLTGSGLGPYQIQVEGMAASAGCTVTVALSVTGIADAAGNALVSGGTNGVITWGEHALIRAAAG
jgi:type 1 fimbria pilin